MAIEIVCRLVVVFLVSEETSTEISLKIEKGEAGRSGDSDVEEAVDIVGVV